MYLDWSICDEQIIKLTVCFECFSFKVYNLLNTRYKRAQSTVKKMIIIKYNFFSSGDLATSMGRTLSFNCLSMFL